MDPPTLLIFIQERRDSDIDFYNQLCLLYYRATIYGNV